MPYNGKYICINIANYTEAIECKIGKVKIEVEQYIDIDTREFVSDKEILNMSKLIKEITRSLKDHSVSTQKVMILSDILGIQTQIEDIDKPLPFYKRDDFLKPKSKDENRFSQKVKYGLAILNSEERFMRLSSDIDSELSGSIVSGFKKEGFKVKCICDSLGGMLNFRELIPFSYDENSKLLLNISKNKAIAVWCFKNVPICEKVWILDNNESVPYQIENYIQRDLRTLRLKTPNIFIVSGENTLAYGELLEYFKKKEYQISSVEAYLKNIEDFNSKYSLTMSMILKNNDKDSVNLLVKNVAKTYDEKLKLAKRVKVLTQIGRAHV